MLDSNISRTPLVPAIDELPCLVQLPSSWLEQYGERMTPKNGDQRRFVRRRFGSENAKAGLEYRTTLSGCPRSNTTWAVYPVSVSRGGIAFLHSEALYPCEKFRVWFADGGTCEIEVARCRRIRDRCFEIGAKFQQQKKRADACPLVELHLPAPEIPC